MQPTAIINPDTGKLAVTKEETLKATLKYCKDTLKNNEPFNEFRRERDNKQKEAKHFLQLKQGQFTATKETFDQMIKKFRASRKRNYDFLTKASKGFQDNVFKMCVRMFEEESFPAEFQYTTLNMIFKGGKGRKEILSNNRFVHCKDVWARTAEGLIVEDGLRGPLIEKSSIYQIGGQPGHRPEELIFVMKSVIAKHLKNKKMLILKLYDISKFFDKETIEDALLTCNKRGADPKAVRLWYKLNQHTQIRVKTGAGISGYSMVGAVLGQGTLGGALISQAVLDEGVMAQFPPGGPLQVDYGTVPLAPVMFQDDLADCSGSLDNARESNRRVDVLTKQLCLELNRDKSVYILQGSKKQKEQIRLQILKEPLMCGQFHMKEEKVSKWLGHYLSSEGLAISVAETVKHRDSKIRGASLEIAQIVNDWRSHLAGGMMTAVTLWERCCVPSLLHGAGTWVDISPETVRR